MRVRLYALFTVTSLCAVVCATPASALIKRPLSDAQKVLSQPTYERRAQQNLPQSKAPIWAVLRKTKIGEDDQRGLFTADFPPEVRALNGKTVTLSGFMLPLDTQAKARHFLLSKYTPVCFFCPLGQPNEVVEVMGGGGRPHHRPHGERHRTPNALQPDRQGPVFPPRPSRRALISLEG